MGFKGWQVNSPVRVVHLHIAASLTAKNAEKCDKS